MTTLSSGFVFSMDSFTVDDFKLGLHVLAFLRLSKPDCAWKHPYFNYILAGYETLGAVMFSVNPCRHSSIKLLHWVLLLGQKSNTELVLVLLTCFPIGGLWVFLLVFHVLKFAHKESSYWACHQV